MNAAVNKEQYKLLDVGQNITMHRSQISVK